jgi:hypothetical protein
MIAINFWAVPTEKHGAMINGRLVDLHEYITINPFSSIIESGEGA